MVGSATSDSSPSSSWRVKEVKWLEENLIPFFHNFPSFLSNLTPDFLYFLSEVSHQTGLTYFFSELAMGNPVSSSTFKSVPKKNVMVSSGLSFTSILVALTLSTKAISN